MRRQTGGTHQTKTSLATGRQVSDTGRDARRELEEGYMTRSIVIGAGMVGLATAWHLQEHGVDVTVVDRGGVAAGSSWGNAGWLAPAKTIPLADPSIWTYGPQAL